MANEFFRFLLVGLINTLISYILYLLFLVFFTYLTAYSFAYCAGILMSYFLNTHYVFKKRVSLARFLKFPVVYVIQYALGIIMLWLIVGKLGFSPRLAMFAVIVISIPFTFLASRFVIKS